MRRIVVVLMLVGLALLGGSWHSPCGAVTCCCTTYGGGLCCAETTFCSGGFVPGCLCSHGVVDE